MEPYYDRDGITIYHGDAREIVPLLGPVDHVITDPPYSPATHAGHEAGRDAGDSVAPAKRQQLGFTGVSASDVAWMLEQAQVSRWAVFTLDDRTLAGLITMPPRGWRYVRTGAWIKPGSAPQFTGDRPAMGWEPVAILHRDEEKLRWM